MRLDVVSVGAVEALLSYCLKLQAAHHGVEEDLQEIHVILANQAEFPRGFRLGHAIIHRRAATRKHRHVRHEATARVR